MLLILPDHVDYANSLMKYLALPHEPSAVGHTTLHSTGAEVSTKIQLALMSGSSSALIFISLFVFYSVETAVLLSFVLRT